MSEHERGGRAATRLVSAQPLGGVADLAAARSAADHEPIARAACRLGDASCAGAHTSAIGRSQGIESSAATGALLRLQRSFGNR